MPAGYIAVTTGYIWLHPGLLVPPSGLQKQTKETKESECGRKIRGRNIMHPPPLERPGNFHFPASIFLPLPCVENERRPMPASFGLSAVLSAEALAKVEGHAKEGEQVAATPLSPEIVAAGEERARELRLYAARLEVLDGRNWGRWD